MIKRALACGDGSAQVKKLQLVRLVVECGVSGRVERTAERICEIADCMR
jgi:hypothetical protein